MKICVSFVIVFLFLVLPIHAEVTNGLVGHWTFDDAQGATVSDSAGTNNGTIYGAQWTSGKVGGALNFDGVNDYVSIADNISLRPQYITVSAWIKTPTNDEEILCKSRYSDATGEQYSLYIASNGKTGGSIKRNSGGLPGIGWQSCNGQTVLSTNNWHLITETWDGSVMKIYIDGQLDGTNSSIPSGAIDNYAGGELKIGVAWSHFPKWFVGTIDDVRIYNRALSADEVQQIYSIPEPATMAMLGLGALLLRRKRA